MCQIFMEHILNYTSQSKPLHRFGIFSTVESQTCHWEHILSCLAMKNSNHIRTKLTIAGRGCVVLILAFTPGNGVFMCNHKPLTGSRVHLQGNSVFRFISVPTQVFGFFFFRIRRHLERVLLQSLRGTCFKIDMCCIWKGYSNT